MNKCNDSRWKYARSLWSRSVLDLFNHTCFLCKRKATDNQQWAAHHLIPCADRHLELLILNGVCLCSAPFNHAVSCHDGVHTIPRAKQVLLARIALAYPQWFDFLTEQQQVSTPRSYSRTDLERDIAMLESLGVRHKASITRPFQRKQEAL